MANEETRVVPDEENHVVAGEDSAVKKTAQAEDCEGAEDSDVEESLADADEDMHVAPDEDSAVKEAHVDEETHVVPDEGTHVAPDEDSAVKESAQVEVREGAEDSAD